MEPETYDDSTAGGCNLEGSPEMSPTIGALAAALAAAQFELEPARRNQANPYFNSRYADIAACREAGKVLASHGLAVTQFSLPARFPEVRVVTLLAHTSGEWVRGEMTFAVQKRGRGGRGDEGGGPGLPTMHDFGSAFTFLLRQGYKAITGTVAEGEDDDANAASGRHDERSASEDRARIERGASEDRARIERGSSEDRARIERGSSEDRARSERPAAAPPPAHRHESTLRVPDAEQSAKPIKTQLVEALAAAQSVEAGLAGAGLGDPEVAVEAPALGPDEPFWPPESAAAVVAHVASTSTYGKRGDPIPLPRPAPPPPGSEAVPNLDLGFLASDLKAAGFSLVTVAGVQGVVLPSPLVKQMGHMAGTGPTTSIRIRDLARTQTMLARTRAALEAWRAPGGSR